MRTAITTRLGFRAEPPHGLAALRIALAVAILISPELWQAPRFAAQPAALRVGPEGLGWLVQHVPIRVGLAYAAQAILFTACVAAISGVAARINMLIVTLSGLYVFGLSQLSGAVIHDMHLFWLSALLAVSPCADVFAIPRRPAPASSLSYGIPLQLARCLLGIVYFFPGFWKLATSGTAWFTSDNLRNQLYWKWYQLGREPPPLRIDRAPANSARARDALGSPCGTAGHAIPAGRRLGAARSSDRTRGRARAARAQSQALDAPSGDRKSARDDDGRPPGKAD